MMYLQWPQTIALHLRWTGKITPRVSLFWVLGIWSAEPKYFVNAFKFYFLQPQHKQDRDNWILVSLCTLLTVNLKVLVKDCCIVLKIREMVSFCKFNIWAYTLQNFESRFYWFPWSEEFTQLFVWSCVFPKQTLYFEKHVGNLFEILYHVPELTAIDHVFPLFPAFPFSTQFRPETLPFLITLFSRQVLLVQIHVPLFMRFFLLVPQIRTHRFLPMVRLFLIFQAVFLLTFFKQLFHFFMQFLRGTFLGPAAWPSLPGSMEQPVHFNKVNLLLLNLSSQFIHGQHRSFLSGLHKVD